MANIDPSQGAHLDGMNQPKVFDDSTSLHSAELFDKNQRVPVEKPLLAAAMQAREAAQMSSTNLGASKGEHLEGMNQPIAALEDDSASLDSTELFDAPAVVSEKPLLAAALKAREEGEKSMGKVDSSSADPIAGMKREDEPSPDTGPLTTKETDTQSDIKGSQPEERQSLSPGRREDPFSSDSSLST
ncbi:MAG: hypothetical protein AAGM67_20845, partial [Bacteroidota bacterium]